MVSAGSVFGAQALGKREEVSEMSMGKTASSFL